MKVFFLFYGIYYKSHKIFFIIYHRMVVVNVIFLYLLIIPLIYIITRFILFIIVMHYGKFSYDGFSAAGFAYNSEKDIFYSTMNAWQKNFGYTHLYDVLAPVLRMIIDTEPIHFYYNNKNWLITFWKGQYGIVTGAEIGVYCTTEQKVNKRTIYLPASSSEMLNMYLILYKNDKVITKVNARHWWLAIFKLGVFSWPKELSMDLNLTFPDKDMLNAFLEAFIKLGYKSDDYKVIDNTFCFKYIKPRTRKVWTRTWLTDKIRQFFNRKNVELYNKYSKGIIDDNGIDDKNNTNKKLIIVNELLPDLIKNDDKDLSIINKIINKKENNIALLNSESSVNNI